MTSVWFITGSSRGLGRAIVEKALDTGANVIATARNPDSLQDLVQRYGSDRCLAVALDVAEEDQVARAVQTGFEKFGRVDIIVNNAGYGNLAAIEDITAKDFRQQMDTNFMGVVNVTKAVLPILREQKSGHIFQVSSIGGRIATPGMCAYQSAKWAVGGFSSVLAQEVAPFGIKVTVLEPGGIRTDWARSCTEAVEISAPYKQTVGYMEKMVADVVGNEISLPEKVSQVIVDLVGKEEPPLRLLIGPDAVEFASKAAKALAESDEKWRSVSESTV
ncbi:uncharacterized protein F5Z01DRAFT_55024 [Emericellopsis atlantica]|uniref:Ketoreductase domain-containing protein n=1 Tax=Emericellopsis atlantica TaxID=2614577 RepID=A0A9P7ZPH3_9HYPO|nr:uncharacterized protein F5Z01DRAFT_55024 [Emericellopsis atlantica]KAG9255456.1 hypothetical protein F5Z01DRAFT_55024 [Emericellopsis atlantica]